MNATGSRAAFRERYRLTRYVPGATGSRYVPGALPARALRSVIICDDSGGSCDSFPNRQWGG